LIDLAKTFQTLNMPPSRYVTFYAVPIVAVGIVLALLVPRLVAPLLPEFVAPLVPILLVAFAAGVAILLPVSLADRKRAEINNAIPFFMTHFGVLSTSNIPRAEIIRILGEKKEYNALADEMQRIYSLVSNWNLSLPQACRFVSKTTPSNILADFLERLAHALETGQDLEVFLRNEQSVVMKEYATVYETSIYQLEGMKDLYLSTMMSGVFLVIFAIITPLLTGIDPSQLLVGILFLFFFLEVLFLFMLQSRAPSDRLWHRLDIVTKERNQIQLLVTGGAAAAIVMFFLLPRLLDVPVGLALAVAVTPMAAAGLFAETVEARVKRREDNYAAFVRSLGSSLAAKGGSLREVLKKLMAHNFGPLTTQVHNLFARLTWRLHDVLAWKHFSAESGSNLIEKFNAMFIEGIRAGGKPQAVGEIISTNVTRILNLRKSRYGTAGTFRRLMLGFTAGMAFTLFIGIGMLDVLNSLFGLASVPTTLVPIHLTIDVDTSGIEEMLFFLLVFHALAAAVMLKLVDGGDWSASFVNFVAMVWIAVLISYASKAVMGGIFTFAG